uniref:Derlin n=1 Tax=Rhizophora mucronata TaxID=61149 RepID=A0A2P2KEY0_RHIMU
MLQRRTSTRSLQSSCQRVLSPGRHHILLCKIAISDLIKSYKKFKIPITISTVTL